MERPQHELRAISGKSKQSKAAGIIVVIVFHVIVITALVLGLAQGVIKNAMSEINASVVVKKVAPPPPPPPPALVKPPPSIVAPPAIVIQAAPPPPPPPAPPPRVAAPPPPPPPPTELKAIERTHSLPPYPALSQRMGEQGTTLMKVTIGTDGKVTACTIVTSSGSARLDAAAVEYVKDNWRWQPPTQLGKPVEATTEVSVKWDLKNAQ